MKHLKKYESLSKIDLIEDCRDILLSLRDDGILVRIDFDSSGLSILIDIIAESRDKLFDIKNYKDDFERLVLYLSKNKFLLKNFNIGVESSFLNKGPHRNVPYRTIEHQNLLKINGTLNRSIGWDSVIGDVLWISIEFRLLSKSN